MCGCICLLVEGDISEFHSCLFGYEDRHLWVGGASKHPEVPSCLFGLEPFVHLRHLAPGLLLLLYLPPRHKLFEHFLLMRRFFFLTLVAHQQAKNV